MEEFDCVKLIKPFKGLPLGTNGVIVHKYNNEDVEVEFFDSDNQTIDVYTVPTNHLEVTWEASKPQK